MFALRMRVGAVLAVVVGVIATMLAGTPAALAQGDAFLAGEVLTADQSRLSSDGRFRLVMQSDGNLVLYGPSGAMWATRTAGNAGSRAAMQSDGNLVVYGPGGNALWESGTWGNNNSRVVVQNDGNVVLYTASGAALYSTSRPWGARRGWNGGVSGNCTWYAYERFRGESGTYPALTGDAHYWDNSARATGWGVVLDAMSRTIVVFEPGVQGASGLGHVAWVNVVQSRSDGRWIHITEMNYNGLGRMNSRWVKDVPGMSYVLAPSL
jgi:hypothetical protein